VQGAAPSSFGTSSIKINNNFHIKYKLETNARDIMLVLFLGLRVGWFSVIPSNGTLSRMEKKNSFGTALKRGRRENRQKESLRIINVTIV